LVASVSRNSAFDKVPGGGLVFTQPLDTGEVFVAGGQMLGAGRSEGKHGFVGLRARAVNEARVEEFGVAFAQFFRVALA
jgi:hypothetical protein